MPLVFEENKAKAELVKILEASFQIYHMAFPMGSFCCCSGSGLRKELPDGYCPTKGPRGEETV